MPTTQEYAEQLAAMVAEVSPAEEARSIENPNVPITATQLSDILSYGPTRSGVQINEHTAMTFTAVFSAVKVLSESVGMLPLAVFNGDDDEDVRTRAKDHPAYSLLRWQPNAEVSAVVFKETMQAGVSLWGNAYARILSNNAGDPIALVPLPSSRTYIERRAGRLVYRVDGGGGTFDPEEILHIPGLSFDGLKGLSPIAYTREAIAMGKAAEIFSASFYANGAAVQGVLEFPNALKPEQMSTVKESWNAQYSGVGNSHKTAVIPFGGKYARIGLNLNDAQFLESRKFQVTEIARIFRVPPHMIGDLERATFSNIEQMSLEFLMFTLAPWLQKFEEELTRKLCGTDGQYHVKFDDRRLLRSDIDARQKFYTVGRQWGFLCADEIRAMEGLPPLPNDTGRIFLSPTNMIPAEKANQVAVPTAPFGTSPPAPAGRDAFAVESLRGVFADAIGRMLRKEAHALERGKADEAFYQSHRQQVREALFPAARSLVILTGRSLDDRAASGVRDVLDGFAAERHSPDAAEAIAAELPARILKRLVSHA